MQVSRSEGLVSSKWQKVAMIAISVFMVAFLIGAFFAISAQSAKAEDGGPTASTCVDDGVARPGEGCDCKDVVCASTGEGPESACGTLCPTNECPDGLACFRGVCWNASICEPAPEKTHEPSGGGGGYSQGD